MKFLKELILLEMTKPRRSKVFYYGESNVGEYGYGLNTIQGSLDVATFEAILLSAGHKQRNEAFNIIRNLDSGGAAMEALINDQELMANVKQWMSGKPVYAFDEEMGIFGFGRTLQQAKLAYLTARENVLGESLVTKSGLKKEEQKKAMAARAADLTQYLDALKVEKDLEKSKMLALNMADHFELGGKENFKQGIVMAKSVGEVQKHAYNAYLKGIGMGTKLY